MPEARTSADDASAWARWNPRAAARPWTVGVEEEAMLLEPGVWSPADRIDDALAALPPGLRAHASAETHACVIELRTDPHPTVAGLARELARLRRGLHETLAERLGLGAAAAGTHPFASGAGAALSSGERYREIDATMRALARREPTMALHVHVAVPDGPAAVRAVDGIRDDLPALLALSANSPYWRGTDSGFASMRTPIFAMFPRVGIPRHFGTYAGYVRVVDAMLRARAVPEPTFLWWDVRLQPRFGTVEVRIMDAASRVEDVAALAAVVQALVRCHAETRRARGTDSELLAESRFLAARDGMRGSLIDPSTGRRRPVADVLGELLERCRAPGATLGCADELAAAERLAADPGDARQRRLAAAHGLSALAGLLSAEFVPAPAPLAMA